MPEMVLAENGIASSGAASGTLVVAALETVGYHAQAQVLSNLSGLFEELGGLIYLGVLFSVVLTVGLMGNYAPALWLLVGPPMFVFASGVSIGGQDNRISAKGPEWRFGAFTDPGGNKERLMKRADSEAQVSFVFHKYNELISELSQTLINSITNKDAEKQVMFMVRQRVMEELFGMELRNGGSKILIGYLLTRCGKEINYARMAAQLKRNPRLEAKEEYKNAQTRYCADFPKKKGLVDDKNALKQIQYIEPSFKEDDMFSCLDLWNWVAKSTQKDVAGMTEHNFSVVFGPEVHFLGAAATVENSADSMLKKLITKAKLEQSSKDPCPFSPLRSEVQGSLGTIVNIFSGLLIRKEMQMGAPQTAFQGDLAGDMSLVNPLDDSLGARKGSIAGNMDKLRSHKANELAAAKKFEAFNIIMMIPYFQGGLLYVLSVMYPFFCLLLLVPGQAGNFFTWMALWAWAKSWDVGWAMVMVVDKILWEIMPNTTHFDLDSGSDATPLSLLEMHFAGDYGYSLALYWLILAAMVSAVPIVMAQIILGAKRAVGGAIIGGVTDFAGRLSPAAEGFVSTDNLGRITQPQEQRQGLAFVQNSSAIGSNLNGFKKRLQKLEDVNAVNDMNNRPLRAASNPSGAAMDDQKSAGSNNRDVQSLRNQSLLPGSYTDEPK
ncbi:MAG TPA: hypothetical protein PKA63_05965 [Oligoflexia bacterium]|nr:hypothetical protein [Oligoflexia bacterium]HMP48196.1 hypothetical protein [Oligoflexia bacterium]